MSLYEFLIIFLTAMIPPNSLWTFLQQFYNLVGSYFRILLYRFVGKKLKWYDVLDVWGVHGVGGSIGAAMLRLFATSAVNPMITKNDLFTDGGYDFLIKQVITEIAVCIYAFVFSYIMLWLINFITTIKVTEQAEESGLESSLHGELEYE